MTAVSLSFGGVTVGLDPHLDVLAVCVGLLVGYWGLVRRYGRVLFPRPGERSVTGGQVAAFAGGVAALLVAGGAPLHDVADQSLFSAHMLEHLLYALVAPPLLLLGVPRWMARLVLDRSWLRIPAAHLSRPVIAGLAFNVALVAAHWPAVVDLMLTSDLFHLVAHGGLVVVSLAMWANVASPAPQLIPRLSPVAGMLFLFLMTLVPTIPSSFLTFGTTPLYEAYTGFAMPWGLTAVADMRIAGLLMKIGGGFFLWGVIAVLYFRWAAAEEAAARPRVSGGPAGDRPDRAPTETDL